MGSTLTEKAGAFFIFTHLTAYRTVLLPIYVFVAFSAGYGLARGI